MKVISVCELEEQLGINLFPQLNEDKKRNTYKLPLSASQVKPNQKIAYSHWDGKSQCAQGVSADNMKALQKQFQPQSGAKEISTTTAPSTTTASGESTITDLVKQIISAALRSLMQDSR